MATQKRFASVFVGSDWVNRTGVQADDGLRASFDNTTQQDLIITGFGFSVPSGATIQGVTVHHQGQGVSATAADRQVDVGLTKDASNLSGSREVNQQYAQDVDTDVNTGGLTFLFGTTLTPAEANDLDFGILLRDSDVTASKISVDVVDVTLTFTLTVFPAVPLPAFDYDESATFVTAVSKLEGRQEQRRSKSATPLRRFRLVWDVLDQTAIDILWDFYIARKGRFEAFDYTSLNDSVVYTVRFTDDVMTRSRFAALLSETGLGMVETNA